MLHPSRPAVSIDAMLLEAAIGGGVGPKGEVWFASTDLSGLKYGHLLAADLKSDWTVRPSDLGYPKGSEFWVFESNKTDTVVFFSEDSPLTLQVST